jgi:hypothetical protein
MDMYIISITYLHYWFWVGEATLQIHHLNSDYAPNKKSNSKTNNLYYWFWVDEATLQIHYLNSDYAPNKKSNSKTNNQSQHQLGVIYSMKKKLYYWAPITAKYFSIIINAFRIISWIAKKHVLPSAPTRVRCKLISGPLTCMLPNARRFLLHRMIPHWGFSQK